MIAAVHNACVGGGVDMVTACDIRMCTKDAWFSIKVSEILGPNNLTGGGKKQAVIAAVHSACVGGGVDKETACDIRMCTKDAWFSIKVSEILGPNNLTGGGKKQAVIAAVHSACVGGGVDKETACDIRMCTKDAWFFIKVSEILGPNNLTGGGGSKPWLLQYTVYVLAEELIW